MTTPNPVLVTRNIGWSVDGKSFRETEGVYHSKIRSSRSLSFSIELENLFGFCEDYDNVVYGMRHKLALVRKSNDGAIFNVAAIAKGKVELTSVAWVMPRVHPNDVKKFNLYKSIESNIVLDAAFRMRKCSIAEIPAQNL